MPALLVASLLGGATLPGGAGALAAGPVPAAGTPAARAASRGANRGIEARVRGLTRKLGLDERQQQELRHALEAQREEVRQIWADPSMTGEDHVGATRAVLAQTEERIRAMLRPEQRSRYAAPKPTPDKPPAPPDVDHWMGLTRPPVAQVAAQAKGK